MFGEMCAESVGPWPKLGQSGSLGPQIHHLFSSGKTLRVCWWDTPVSTPSIIVFLKHSMFPTFNIRFRISQLLKLTNAEVYPILNHCTIPGGVNACPTRDSDKVRLQVLLAARNHGVMEISVPKTGFVALCFFGFIRFVSFTVQICSGDKILDVSSYLRPHKSHESYIWEETATEIVFRLRSGVSSVDGISGCACFPPYPAGIAPLPPPPPPPPPPAPAAS